MRLPRSSGILLHVTSLPGRYGIGDLGQGAYRFVDFLANTGQTLWQVLPIGPTGYGNSPYQSPSAFAGNSLLVSLEQLVCDGWLSEDDLALDEPFPADEVDFDRVAPWRQERLARAAGRFAATASPADRREYAEFRQRHAVWLDEYALFMAIKREHGGVHWIEWEQPLARRDAAAIAQARTQLAAAIESEVFVQFQFVRQWAALKRYANDHGVRIMGDVPIFVAHDSADVWSHQDLFHLDDHGRATLVAGVPPDYFSATGQLWGNPLYRWDVLAARDFDWWIERFRNALATFDLVRLDHFRGFEAYWEVPGDARDAIGGHWAPGPGAALFRAAEAALGPLPLVAEDLGVITPAVDALRDELGFPGMRVLQFAFGNDVKAADYEPHNYPRHCVVYTGTHDNDTTVGWFNSSEGVGTTRSAEDIRREQLRTLEYLGTDGREVHWDLIRLAWASVADTAVAPLQDVLGLGSEARMNLPGTSSGNWRWRFRAEQLTDEIAARLRRLTDLYDRSPSSTASSTTSEGSAHAAS